MQKVSRRRLVLAATLPSLSALVLVGVPRQGAQFGPVSVQLILKLLRHKVLLADVVVLANFSLAAAFVDRVSQQIGIRGEANRVGAKGKRVLLVDDIHFALQLPFTIAAAAKVADKHFGLVVEGQCYCRQKVPCFIYRHKQTHEVATQPQTIAVDQVNLQATKRQPGGDEIRRGNPSSRLDTTLQAKALVEPKSQRGASLGSRLCTLASSSAAVRHLNRRLSCL